MEAAGAEFGLCGRRLEGGVGVGVAYIDNRALGGKSFRGVAADTRGSAATTKALGGFLVPFAAGSNGWPDDQPCSRAPASSLPLDGNPTVEVAA